MSVEWCNRVSVSERMFHGSVNSHNSLSLPLSLQVNVRVVKVGDGDDLLLQLHDLLLPRTLFVGVSIVVPTRLADLRVTAQGTEDEQLQLHYLLTV